MTRRSIGLAALFLLLPAAPPLLAQDEPATHLYEAYYKVGFDELGEWQRQFQTYVLPVLQELQEEGVVEGWGHWQHNVGSDYNVRFAIRAPDWASLDTFWARYLEGVFGGMPEDEAALAQRMIEGHKDHIWTIGNVQVPADGPPNNFLYASTFQVSFADLEEWTRIWEEVALPILARAQEQGILNGVVTLNHNTGPTHNMKVLYLFEEWDDMDDMWALFFSAMEEEHPEELATSMAMIRGHDDVIWSTAQPN